MHPFRRRSVLALASIVPMSCSPSQVPVTHMPMAAEASITPLILDARSGERRVRRPGNSRPGALTTPFIIKVDRRNGGSSDLVMGTEDIPPGEAIPPHRHLVADEIVFIHRGSGAVELGDQRREVGEGATVYIPKNVRITLRNTGTMPMSIVFTFSKPGFEELMRDNSVLEGQPVLPLSDADRAANRTRHQWHTIYDQP
jgi:mannose-6-phosphate isomerase-like protein (cupin superfamily)